MLRKTRAVGSTQLSFEAKPELYVSKPSQKDILRRECSTKRVDARGLHVACTLRFDGYPHYDLDAVLAALIAEQVVPAHWVTSPE